MQMNHILRIFEKLIIFSIIIFVLPTAYCKNGNDSSTYNKANNELGVIHTEYASLRADPLVFSAQVFQLKKGVKVEIFARSKEKTWVGNTSNYWYKVKLANGISGWVYGNDIKIFSNTNEESMKNYISDFWEVEESKLRKELTGKWWSIDEIGDFTEHCVEINSEGTYLSYKKGGQRISGDYNFNFIDKEIIFLNGTSFNKSLNYMKRGMTYFLENKSDEKAIIKFRRISTKDGSYHSK